MADPKGFMSTPRETPSRRPVDVRIMDWHEVYNEFGSARLEKQAGRFGRVMPKDYKRVLEAASQAEQDGRDVNQAVMAAAHG